MGKGGKNKPNKNTWWKCNLSMQMQIENEVIYNSQYGFH